MKHHRLSAIFVAATAATVLMASSTGFAAQKHHKASAKAASEVSYKGENFKAEVPAPCPPAMVLRDGFYVGIGGGYDSYRIERKSIYNLDASNYGEFKSDHSATGWVGSLFAGYGMYFDTFYLGGELSAAISNAESTVNYLDVDAGIQDSGKLTMKARTSYGAAILPGLKVNDSTLMYVRLGYVKTKFEGKISNIVDDGVAMPSVSDHDWEGGFNYGIGMETYLAENVSARGEYTHTSYGSHKVSRRLNDVEIGSTKLSPSNNQFMLSLIYHV